jgi:hypothetical protein
MVQGKEVTVEQVCAHDAEDKVLALFRGQHAQDQGQDAVHKVCDGLPVSAEDFKGNMISVVGDMEKGKALSRPLANVWQ